MILSDAHSGTLIRQFDTHGEDVFSTTFSPNGAVIVGRNDPVAAKRYAVWLWNSQTGDYVQPPRVTTEGTFVTSPSLTFVTSEEYLLAGRSFPAGSVLWKFSGPTRKELAGEMFEFSPVSGVHALLAEPIAATQTATRQYAKRQLTWMRHQMVAWSIQNEQESKKLYESIFSILKDSGLTTQFS